MLNMKVVSWALGVTTLISYLVCVTYGEVATPASLHMTGFLRAGVARVQVAHLVGLSHRSGREFSLRRLCGNGVCAGLQLLQKTLGQRLSQSRASR